MPHTPTAKDLKREAIYKAKQAAHKIEQAHRKATRIKEDGILNRTPPSTMTEISRMIEDIWKDDIKPAVAKLNVNIKREVSELGKDIHKLIQSNETTADIAEKFNNLSKKIAKNPVMKALGNFCSKAADLVKSIAGTSKDRAKAWKNMKAATSKVKTEIKKAVGMQKSSGFTR